uniref:Uncharacterized protein n=1 Tax=Oryza rufipogon TaxID=4529 RepID=A0A0E0Q5W6_ORYRU
MKYPMHFYFSYPRSIFEFKLLTEESSLPDPSPPSAISFAHDDVTGELAIFKGTSTSWVVVAGAVSLAPVVVAGAAPIAVEIAVGELGFADNGEWGMGNRDG